MINIAAGRMLATCRDDFVMMPRDVELAAQYGIASTAAFAAGVRHLNTSTVIQPAAPLAHLDQDRRQIRPPSLDR
jgi:hypothetical protein